MNTSYIFNKILGLIGSVFDAYSTVLFLPTPGREDQFELAAYFSLSDNILTNAKLEPGKGLVGWIIRNNQPLLINDFDRKGDCLGYYTRESESKIKAFMGCPLTNGQGVVCLDSKKTYSFSAKDQKILHQFVQLIESLQNNLDSQTCSLQEHNYYQCLQLIKEIKAKNLRWSIFLNKFLTALAEFTNFKYAFLATRDELGHGFYLEGWNREIFSSQEFHKEKFNISGGLIGWVFKNHTYISTAEKEKNTPGTQLFEKKFKTPAFQSVVCLPLIVHLRTRAVLVLADLEQKHIDSQLKGFLNLIADDLAQFLENLYLKNKLKEHSASVK